MVLLQQSTDQSEKSCEDNLPVSSNISKPNSAPKRCDRIGSTSVATCTLYVGRIVECICHVHIIYQSVKERVVRQQRLSRARVRGQCRHISRPETAGYRVWARGRIGREPEATRPALHTPSLELSTGLREISQCLEKALTTASSLCKVPTSALTMDVSEPKN